MQSDETNNMQTNRETEGENNKAKLRGKGTRGGGLWLDVLMDGQTGRQRYRDKLSSGGRVEAGAKQRSGGKQKLHTCPSN